MKIVVLDGATLNPGNLSWTELKQLGPCEIYDRTAAADVVSRARGADILLTNKTGLNDAALTSLPNLRYVGVLATGYNIVDIAAARDKNIPVTNIPAYGTKSVAQHTFALLLELTNQVGRHAAGVREGQWSHSLDFCYAETPLIELDGQTLGLVGTGRIAQAVARLGEAMGMRVLFATRVGERAQLERVLDESDVLSLHCPLTLDIRELINATILDRMKSSAFLLNTSRGALIAEDDLADALNAGRIAGAAVDVLSVEPPPPTNPLLTARTCLVTPHQAWATRAARHRLMTVAVENVRAFVAGTPRNVVN
jgi:glycerate dehydrogenase